MSMITKFVYEITVLFTVFLFMKIMILFHFILFLEHHIIFMF